jgi:hypothetical protein
MSATGEVMPSTERLNLPGWNNGRQLLVRPELVKIATMDRAKRLKAAWMSWGNVSNGKKTYSELLLLKRYPDKALS